MARAGAVVGTSTTCPSRAITLMPQARPKIAVMIGSPIATTVPNVSSRMTIAVRSPTTSERCVLGLETFLPR